MTAASAANGIYFLEFDKWSTAQKFSCSYSLEINWIESTNFSNHNKFESKYCTFQNIWYYDYQLKVNVDNLCCVTASKMIDIFLTNLFLFRFHTIKTLSPFGILHINTWRSSFTVNNFGVTSDRNVLKISLTFILVNWTIKWSYFVHLLFTFASCR